MIAYGAPYVKGRGYWPYPEMPITFHHYWLGLFSKIQNVPISQYLEH